MSRLRLSILGTKPLGACILGASPAVEVVPPVPIVVNPLGEFATWLRGRLGTNVYPNRLPQKDLGDPLLCYAVIDGETVMELAGATGLRRWVLQFDAWGSSLTECFAAQQRLFAVLGRYRGPVGRATLQGAVPGRSMTSYDQNPAQDDDGFYRAMQEWDVWISS